MSFLVWPVNACSQTPNSGHFHIRTLWPSPLSCLLNLQQSFYLFLASYHSLSQLLWNLNLSRKFLWIFKWLCALFFFPTPSQDSGLLRCPFLVHLGPITPVTGRVGSHIPIFLGPGLFMWTLCFLINLRFFFCHLFYIFFQCVITFKLAIMHGSFLTSWILFPVALLMFRQDIISALKREMWILHRL